jgi:hypothetical protein
MYSEYFFVIFEKLLEKIHALFVECPIVNKFQNDIDLKLTKIKKIFDAIAVPDEYTSIEHNNIFGTDNITFENILQIKGQASIISLPNIPAPSIPNIPTPTMSNITKNPVTNAVKDNAGKFGSFITGAFDQMTGKDKSAKK